MGAFSSRNRNAAVEQDIATGNCNAYKFPPRSGNFFGSHFIMGGERFDTPQPETYLFGENADLNFLGNRPSAFPYPPPQANEPTKTLKSLVNIRKESVRLVRVLQEKPVVTITNKQTEQVDGNVLASLNDEDVGVVVGSNNPQCQNYLYNVEFVFDSDAKCAITIYYFCTEEVSPSGVTLTPQDGLISETYHYEKGINQVFSQPAHIFNPQIFSEDDLTYNPTKEQYPVAIHCVVEEGNEECRQSHTTICVIDHHADSSSYVLRALKQKIFVDGLCYLLQEIYGIENKAVNKSSVDEDLDDHGSECVICMSETRDTLILPCRHLCLCNSCADSLRYQANNCPICRAPFRALLQIRAVQKGISSHIMHQNTPASTIGDTAPCDQNVPPGYIPVSLIEALNGPLQFMARTRPSETDGIDGVATISSADGKQLSPVKVNSHRKNKVKKHASTSTCVNEIGMTTLNQNSALISNDNDNAAASAEVDEVDDAEKPSAQNSLRKTDKVKIVNERAYAKAKQKTNASGANMPNEPEDEDSENEKLSPLLSHSSKNRNSAKLDDSEAEHNSFEMKTKTNLQKKHSLADDDDDSANRSEINISAIDADCSAENAKNQKYGCLTAERNNVGYKGNMGVGAIAKKTLHTKSTSAGNITGTTAAQAAATATKANVVSSLPDMLDSPMASNATSTRSSSDSYSSSSSTKQLLTNIPPANAANIIIDEKTALQNAVNV